MLRGKNVKSYLQIHERLRPQLNCKKISLFSLFSNLQMSNDPKVAETNDDFMDL